MEQISIKTLFCIFFKSNSPVLIHTIGKGMTVDHKDYIENCLKPFANEIWKHAESSGTKNFKQFDNSLPHTHPNGINYLSEASI